VLLSTPGVSALVAGVLLVAVLLVAGCGGGSAPTDEPVSASEETGSTETGLTVTGGEDETGTTIVGETEALPADDLPALELAEGERLFSGSTGPAVEALQMMLNALGYKPGLPDGTFGARTEKAVIAFQRDRRLAADGVVGPKTVAALNEALTARG
jgi:peptidoglycan hydrolase-like protein with peptidoglycan-binding domain